MLLQIYWTMIKTLPPEQKARYFTLNQGAGLVLAESAIESIHKMCYFRRNVLKHGIKAFI